MGRCLMRRCATLFALGLLQVGLLSIASSGYAQIVWHPHCTDRFGYTGTAIYYPTQSDYLGTPTAPPSTLATATCHCISSTATPTARQNQTVVMGSWWYTTDPSGNPGYGNTHGNAGVGFMQLYDGTAVTTTTCLDGFLRLRRHELDDVQFGGERGQRGLRQRFPPASAPSRRTRKTTAPISHTTST